MLLPSADLIASTSDAKFVRVAGKDTYPAGRPGDALDIIDAGVFPPRLLYRVDVSTTIIGPPQAVAINPAGTLAVIGASSHYDRTTHRPVFEERLQVVDLTTTVPAVSESIPMSGHPQGLAFNRAGSLLLAATTAGTVDVLRIDGSRIIHCDTLKICNGRLAGLAITPDGSAALVALRDEQGLVVLDISATDVSLAQERISTGVAPYAIDICSSGCWGVVGNVGLPGLKDTGPLICADADTVTLLDLSQRPFRAVHHATVPSIPEGVAISPDGKWVAVLSMDGSNLPPARPGHKPRGCLQLFSILENRLLECDAVPAGAGGQGVVFSADSRYVLAQYNVEERIAIFDIATGRLVDTGVAFPCRGGPVSIRSKPR